ncbi:hypothetical protein A176_006486 [Myxococcus hansupus]|uniref:Uncharacterized protein n=1 Tax=Pseudomyxococcus hansupus TaxID=1297742 RepID=A0A0H4X336_9BACT|nr:hypothetical protein A176_006486 [Myxococcus hansupus]
MARGPDPPPHPAALFHPRPQQGHLRPRSPGLVHWHHGGVPVMRRPCP